MQNITVGAKNLSAARRHRRSQKFLHGMLAAQRGVIVSTLAIAARKRNLLWSVAAIAGFVCDANARSEAAETSRESRCRTRLRQFILPGL